MFRPSTAVHDADIGVDVVSDFDSDDVPPSASAAAAIASGGEGGGEEDRRRGDDEGGERALDGRPTRGNGESVDGDQEEGDGDGDAVRHHRDVGVMLLPLHPTPPFLSIGQSIGT